MIIDQFSNVGSFQHLPWYASIAEFLRDTDLLSAEPGRYDVHGDDLFVIVADDVHREAHPPLEAHRSYIDLQIALSGSFDVLWRPLGECTDELQPYSEEDDVLLMSDHASTRLTLTPGIAAVFFPQDAHAPQPPAVRVRKAVFKIRV